ncbi:S1 RNA-binding domain-containing protein [Nocardia sp. NPDC127579]|uniref:S1 RNA-binding domain-containing protein n=1 Tax=Nocardia sp. NPDC127579 TaxID=3345402 RepID=UPI00362AAFC8
MSQPEWPEFVQAHSVGGVLEGAVVQIVAFGAFLELAPGIHGLLHRNEWPDWSNGPEVGSTLSVRIVDIDATRQRVALAPA